MELAMLVWRGWGILVVALSFAALLLTQLAGDAILGDGYYSAHGWPKFVALAMAALFVWLFSRLLDARPGRVVIDKDTGEQLTLRGGDHLFFVPVRFWPPILLIAGLGFAVLGPVAPAAQARLQPSSPRTSSAARPTTAASQAPAPAPVPVALASSGDLSGRWNGSRGSDGIREVVVDLQDGVGFAGRSFFENSDGTAVVGGEGAVSGTVTDAQVTFTITRDGRSFVWTGMRTDSGRTLTGQFEGFSNDATYRRP
jgi:hypothetical protein